MSKEKENVSDVFVHASFGYDCFHILSNDTFLFQFCIMIWEDFSHLHRFIHHRTCCIATNFNNLYQNNLILTAYTYLKSSIPAFTWVGVGVFSGKESFRSSYLSGGFTSNPYNKV